jgi:stage V sporulation protein G
MSIEVTSVRVYPVEDGNERLLSFASVVFNDEFVVHNMRLVEADSGIIVAMPNEEYRGNFRDIAHPITNGCRERIREAIVEEFNREVPDAETIDEEEMVNG